MERRDKDEEEAEKDAWFASTRGASGLQIAVHVSTPPEQSPAGSPDVCSAMCMHAGHSPAMILEQYLC